MSNRMSPDIAQHAALDARMVRAVRAVRAVRGIKLLGMVSWPASVQQAFLGHRRLAAGIAGYPRGRRAFATPVRAARRTAARQWPDHPRGRATFAEQITGSIDIERMKRVSLRIEAVAMAMEGADFVQVFRGVPVTGGSAFTKDTVYLRGLIGVHTFFRWALKQRKLRLCRQLFAGKMTLGDAVRFEPLFLAGSDGANAVLVPPRWLPRWLSRANGLAGMLAFSLFANRIRLDAVAEAPMLSLD